MKKIITLALCIVAATSFAQQSNVIEAIPYKPVLVPEGVATIFYPVGDYSFDLLVNGKSVEESDYAKYMLSLSPSDVRKNVTKYFGTGVPVACAVQLTFTEVGNYEVQFDFNVRRGNAINVDKTGRVSPLSGSKVFTVKVDHPQMALAYKDTIGAYIIGERDSLNFYTKGFDKSELYEWRIFNEEGTRLDAESGSYVNISEYLVPENIGVNKIEMTYAGKPFKYYNPETGGLNNSSWYYIVNVPRDYLVETDWGTSDTDPLLISANDLLTKRFRTFKVYYEFATRRLPAEFRADATFEVYINGRRSDLFFNSLQSSADLSIDNGTQALYIPLRLNSEAVNNLKNNDEIRLDISYVDIYDNVISSSYYAKITNN